MQHLTGCQPAFPWELLLFLGGFLFPINQKSFCLFHLECSTAQGSDSGTVICLIMLFCNNTSLTLKAHLLDLEPEGQTKSIYLFWFYFFPPSGRILCQWQVGCSAGHNCFWFFRRHHILFQHPYNSTALFCLSSLCLCENSTFPTGWLYLTYPICVLVSLSASWIAGLSLLVKP